MPYDDEVPLADAAQRLQVPWTEAWKLVLTGHLKARKERGRWLVDAQSLAKCATQRKNGAAAVLGSVA